MTTGSEADAMGSSCSAKSDFLYDDYHLSGYHLRKVTRNCNRTVTSQVNAISDCAATKTYHGKEGSVTGKAVAIMTGVSLGTGSAIVRRFAGGGFRVLARPLGGHYL
jgi:hypothetical protein